MTKYCFSTPKLYKEGKETSLEIAVWTVFIATPEGSITQDYEFDEKEYANLSGTGIYDSFLDLEENVFEPFNSKLDLTGVYSELEKAGMSHNSSLDIILEKWIAEKEESGIKASKKLFKKSKQPKHGPTIEFRNTHS